MLILLVTGIVLSSLVLVMTEMVWPEDDQWS